MTPSRGNSINMIFRNILTSSACVVLFLTAFTACGGPEGTAVISGREAVAFSADRPSLPEANEEKQVETMDAGTELSEDSNEGKQIEQ